MAKGGINLNPGADPTLTAAAYRAGMANVPKDLSGTYEKLAESYDKTMRSIAASWSGVIKDVSSLAATAISKAIKNRQEETEAHAYDMISPDISKLSEDKRAEIGTYEDYTKDVKGGEKGYQKYRDEEIGTGVKDTNILSKEDWEKGQGILSKKEWEELNLQNTPLNLGEELVEIRKNLRGLFLKTDKDSRIEKQQLKIRRKKLFSELNILRNTDNFNNENLANGLIDEGASGKLALLMQNALSAYKTKSGKIQEA